MIGGRRLAAGVIALVLGAGTSRAQFGVLPSTESIRVAQEVAKSLTLPPEDAQRVLEAALPWDACLAHWNARQDSLESADVSEEVLLAFLADVRRELATCRLERKRDIRAALPEHLRTTYDDMAQPERPAVLHFGLHNRMECVVCKPSPTQSP
jgi:hypothetical protein